VFFKKNNSDKNKEKINFKTWANSVEIFSYLKPYRFTYLLGLSCLLISSISAILFPYLLGNLLGVDVTQKQNQFSLLDTNNINALFILLLSLFSIQSVASFFRIYLFGIVTENTLRDIRKVAFKKLIGQNIDFFNTNKVGELQSRVSADISLLAETFNTTLAEFLRQLLTIFFGIIFITLLSWKLSLIMLGIIPVIAIFTVFFGKYIKKLSRKTQDATAISNNILLEGLSGIKNVKSMVNEVFEFKKYNTSIDQINQLGKYNAIWRGLFAGFIILIMFGSIIFVIWQGIHMVSDNSISNAQFFQFLLYTIMIAASFGGISSLIGNIQKAVGATERLLEILNKDTEISIDSIAIKPSSLFQKELRFEKVNFSYKSRPELEIIKDLTIEIPIGKQTAIVGASGAGKSTLSQLLLRFYHPTKGEIIVDGKNYSDYDLANYRNNIGIVPQEIFLFGGTIYENIAYGSPNADKKRILAAAEIANVLEFTNAFPNKLDTIVGDRGVQLSGGQKQRIAIARAILKNPPLLILDEATSALDNNTEKIVQESLQYLLKDRTSLVIAHRLSTIKNATNIIVLENGRIVEQGIHESLISLNGLYTKLYEAQNKTNSLDTLI